MRNYVITAIATLCALGAFAFCRAAQRLACAADDRCELIVFTFREPGVCPPCDRARPIAQRLAKEFPIRFEYFDDPNGDAARTLWRVDRAPTFILTTIPDYGEPREILRWLGADDVERRIRAAFASVGVRPGAPTRPRPFAPKPVPKPRPKPARATCESATREPDAREA